MQLIFNFSVEKKVFYEKKKKKVSAFGELYFFAGGEL